MKKRFLSLSLVLVMFLALLPTAALATKSEFSIDENGVLTRYTGSGGHVTIPSDVTAIGAFAFSECESLTSVDIPSSVTSIGGLAFQFCTGLTSVNIPSGVTVIEDYTFAGCRNLTSVNIPFGVTSIGRGAFGGCASLANVTVPPSVTKIGPSAFYGTPWLKTLGEFAIVNGILLQYQGNGGDVVIPEGVTSIDKTAFESFDGSDSITSVTLPDSLAHFHADTFSDLNADIQLSDKVVANIHQDWDSRWTNPSLTYSQDEAITAIANRIVAEAGATTDYEKAKAICYWIADNVKYNAEVAIENGYGINVADYAEENRKPMSINANTILTVPGTTTICEGYSNVTNALLSAVGIPSRKVNNSNILNHAWNEVFVDGRWLIVDTTWMAPISNVNGVSGQYEINEKWFDATKPQKMLAATDRYSALIRYASGRSAAEEENTPNEWAQAEVWEAICGKLAPYDLQSAYRSSITREEFCRLMVCLVEQASGMKIDDYLRSKGLTAKNTFTDTGDANVAAAHALGIVYGQTETTFAPGNAITRQEAAAMLSRAAKLLGLSAGDAGQFTDAGQFAVWAQDGIAFVSGLVDPVNGYPVMGGVGNGTFAPTGTYTREQAIASTLRIFHCAV